MLEIEVDNRSGGPVDAEGAAALARRVLETEGVEDGELGIAFVTADEMRTLKREHLGLDEPTDVLSFPIDGTQALPEGEPRALGDVVLCPAVVGEEWRWPLVHGLLHLLGHEHGAAMEARERAHLP
ncbi:MAG TPA: rRNA maturation RNase YbeY [Gaiella sp.]|jgi:probable rRNA maturation factor|nr:rRNA maturation RNase YbeY [Gaiella sp.]